MSRRSILIVPTLLVVAAFCLGPMRESDLFFRIQAGREILAAHGLPERNLFSFTFPDYPDLDTAWAFEVLVAALHAAGGFRAVVLAKTALLILMFAAAWRLCRRMGAGAAATALALAGAALVMRDRMVERPHLISFAFELLFVTWMARQRGVPKRSAAAGVLVAVVVWANFHAGVFIAPVLLGTYAIGSWLEGRRCDFVTAALLVPGALAAMALTPVGVGIFRYLAVHIEITRAHPVDEFRAATLISDPALFAFACVSVVVVLAGLVLTVGWRWTPRQLRAKLPWRILLPTLTVGGLGFFSVRFAADFGWIGAPLLATQLHLLFGAVGRRRPKLASLLQRPATFVVGVLLFGSVVVERAVAVQGGRPLFDIDVDREELPLDAIGFINRNGLRERMYNDFEVGSYLAFEGYPRYRVFVDPRLPAYPLHFHRLLGRFDVSRAEWSGAMRLLGVDSALLAYAGLNRRVAWWDPNEWALVYRQRDARVFVRRLPRWRELIASLEIPATFTFTVEEGAVTVPLEQQPAASPVPACEWSRRVGDLLFELSGTERSLVAYQRALSQKGCLAHDVEASTSAWVGAVEAKDVRHAEPALQHLDRALELDPGDSRSRVNRALLLEKLGRNDDARSDWAEIGRQEPATDLGLRALERARSLQ